MAYSLLKATHFIGLALVVGGPVFWHLVSSQGGRPGRPGRAGTALWTVGLSLFLAAAVLDGARAAADLYGSVSAEDVWIFLRTTRFGRIVLVKCALALAYVAVAAASGRSRAGRLFLVLLGGGLIGAASATGHAAAGGWTGLVVDFVHVAAMAGWGGALAHFALALWSEAAKLGPQPASRPAPLAVQARRFAWLGTVAVTALAGTGALLAARLIYGLPALTATPYGGAFLVKLGVFGALLAVAAVNHFVFVPALERGIRGAGGARGFRRAVAAEALLLVLVLGVTGVLTTQVPPQEPQVLAEPVRAAGSLDGYAYDVEVVPQAAGSLRFTLRLLDEEGRPVTGPALTMDLTMPGHVMPPYRAALRPAGAGVFQADLILPMSGRWRIAIDLAAAVPVRQRVDFELRTATSPRESQQVWYFTLYRAFRWPSGVLWLAVYLGLAVFAGWSIRLARGKHQYRALAVAAQLLLFISVWQIVSLFVAKGYPTADHPNPVPATAGAVAEGRLLFQTYCAQCHGPEARGDGPLAGEMWPPPSDLTLFAPMHTDGELYWFISKGLPGTEMPAFEGLLSEEERWTIVRYLRSLRATGPAAAWLQRHGF